MLAEIDGRRDAIVALAGQLIALDTTARLPADPPRAEAELQALLAGRLAAAGAAVETFEPDASDVAGHSLTPDGGVGFAGRPQLIARFAGLGGGRSLIFNGHIDAVATGPHERWASDPFAPEVRDGLLYGRGACDMKGAVAAMVVAAEVLAELRVPLRGDLIVNTVTDEESSGVGALACVRRGLRADAAIVPEPSGLDVWTACRGSVYATITVPGRAGHAEIGQPDWREGGAVSAIEKTAPLLDGIARLRAHWRGREELRHPRLAPPDIVPTLMAAGDWPVTYPDEARLTCAVPYLPVQADASGWSADVEAEVEAFLLAACADDDWLAEHPPRFAWHTAVMPTELPDDAPIVRAVLAAADAAGRPAALGALDAWFDGATLALEGGIPSLMYGPRRIEVAHTVDEHVPVDDLVQTARTLALTALRFCDSDER